MNPLFMVVAGPNGSGKSSLTAGNFWSFGENPLLDPDALARSIENQGEGLSDLQAGRRVLQRVERYIAEHTSFSVETTLSGKWVLSAMEKAKAAHFRIRLIFVATESVEINIARIQNRISHGGHFVPDDDVRRRYTRSFELLPRAICLSDETVLFDNSSSEGYRLIAALGVNEPVWASELPAWAKAVRNTLP